MIRAIGVLSFLAVLAVVGCGGDDGGGGGGRAPELWKVDAGAVMSGDGKTWATAFETLQEALDVAISNDEIWVAEGTYYPTEQSDPGTTRTETFQLLDGVAVYGGFAGTEITRSARDWATHVTILSGDIGTPVDDTDNAYHVVTGADNATLDGFTVTAGNADGVSSPHGCGGGMYNCASSPTVTNCIFSNNSATYGGGMYNDSSSPTVTSCTFSGNSAESGGGMLNDSSSPTLTNCTFSSNSATIHGGGIYNDSSSPTVTNCTFSGNSATSNGGGMDNFSSSPTVANCILWGNTATAGSEVYSSNSSAPTFSHCDIAACGGSGGGWIAAFGTDGGGNIDADPIFIGAGDLRLVAGGPCIDTGDTTALPADTADLDGDGDVAEVIPYDLDGNPRVAHNRVNMGAYEALVTDWKVDADVATSGDGKTWATAFETLQEALVIAAPDDEIWVAEGTYYLTSGTTRTETFQLLDGVAVYGGFAGTETTRSARDWTVNFTILSGDIGTIGIDADNAYHVVTGADGATIDGFTVTAGNANGSSPNNSGGGMYCFSSSPTVTNCTFFGNSATNYGGGMYNNSSSSTVTSCTFSGNSAYNGGGMYNASSSPTVTNCTFSGNSADSLGGGMHNGLSSPTVTNCTFSENSADNGGGMCNNSSSSPTVTNCILWGNTATAAGPEVYNNISTSTFGHCDIRGCGGSGGGWVAVFGTDGGGNIEDDPMFIGVGDLRLAASSPCIDAGDTSALPADTADLDGDGDTGEVIPYDLDGNARVDGGGTVDMGAYEVQ